MKIALLGYGKEGQAAEAYFLKHNPDAEIKVYQDFTVEEISKEDFSDFDLVLRSPSVHPMPGVTSMTRYFFEHCPCPIIGVTATKGKGTTCSFIESILKAMGEKVYLVGNIGNPAITVLDDLTADSVVVYEMSSFQLWDLEKSPHVAVVGMLEPDHLNVHDGYEDYLSAKANIGRHQNGDDFMIYYANNPDSVKVASESLALKITYPSDEIPVEILDAVKIPGRHNIENAMAAVMAVASYYGKTVSEFIAKNAEKIKTGLSNFKGLPHRLEFLREFNGVKYYDDNFATNPASTRVAIQAFPSSSVVAIIGGRDKTDNADIPEVYEVISAPNVKKIILMGESGHEIAKRYQDERFTVAESLEEAVSSAQVFAEKLPDAVVLMSPAAASFDMFENVYDRGDQFQKLVSKL